MTCGQDEHCCWIDGLLCRFVEENTVEGRRWACGLRRELGSWAAVSADARYMEHLQPFWDRFRPGRGCSDWLRPDEVCAACGDKG